MLTLSKTCSKTLKIKAGLAHILLVDGAPEASPVLQETRLFILRFSWWVGGGGGSFISYPDLSLDGHRGGQTIEPLLKDPPHPATFFPVSQDSLFSHQILTLPSSSGVGGD